MDPPEWSPRTTYLEGTRVTLDGKTYEALTYTSGFAPDSAKAADSKAWRLLEEDPLQAS